MSRCTGHCCKAFTLPLTPDELRRSDAAATLAERTGKPAVWRDDQGVERYQVVEDARQIAEMVIPLPFPGLLPDGRQALSQHYTCRHHDPVTGNCGIYETRPRMCSEFPYDRPCVFPQVCTWTEGKLGMHPSATGQKPVAWYAERVQQARRQVWPPKEVTPCGS